MTAFLFVHGGSHGSWCWDRVAERLRDGGHQTLALDLADREDPRAEVTLQQWVDQIGEAVDRLGERTASRPTLVAHSMGGLSASQFADQRPGAIEELVYVCAVVPPDGQSGLEALSRAGASSQLMRDGALVPSADGLTVSLDREAARLAFYQRCSSEVADMALARIGHEHVVPLGTPLKLGGGFASVAKRWVAATEDQAVPLELQVAMARSIGADLSVIVADHSPFFSADVELATVLEAS